MNFPGTCVQHYTHSNVRIPFARYLELVFVTPRYHFVHHSIDRHLSNSNFGFLFSLWDRILGTYTDPGTIREDEPLGLDYSNAKWRLLIGIPPRAVTPPHNLR
jgi:sterol desaturase/sphingolipid hydroxylase (fatty acid hydroxylase superfamily)